jgi:hypothetical protein
LQLCDCEAAEGLFHIDALAWSSIAVTDALNVTTALKWFGIAFSA